MTITNEKRLMNNRGSRKMATVNEKKEKEKNEAIELQ